MRLKFILCVHPGLSVMFLAMLWWGVAHRFSSDYVEGYGWNRDTDGDPPDLFLEVQVGHTILYCNAGHAYIAPLGDRFS